MLVAVVDREDIADGIALGVAVGMAALELVSHKMVEDVPVGCSYQPLLECQTVDGSQFEDCSLFEDLQWDLCTWVQGLEPPQSGGLGQKEVVEVLTPFQV